MMPTLGLRRVALSHSTDSYDTGRAVQHVIRLNSYVGNIFNIFCVHKLLNLMLLGTMYFLAQHSTFILYCIALILQ